MQQLCCSHIEVAGYAGCSVSTVRRVLGTGVSLAAITTLDALLWFEGVKYLCGTHLAYERGYYTQGMLLCAVEGGWGCVAQGHDIHPVGRPKQGMHPVSLHAAVCAACAPAGVLRTSAGCMCVFASPCVSYG